MEANGDPLIAATLNVAHNESQPADRTQHSNNTYHGGSRPESLTSAIGPAPGKQPRSKKACRYGGRLV